MKVRDIYIQIQNHDFCSEVSDLFLGRKLIQTNLRRRLQPSKKNTRYRGAYLVAGYRGMGKSTLVRKVIESINKPVNTKIKDGNSGLFKYKKRPEMPEKKIISIDVYLSQGNLNDYDLLRQMFIQLDSKLKLELHQPYEGYRKPLLALLSFVLLFGGSYAVWHCLYAEENSEDKFGLSFM